MTPREAVHSDVGAAILDHVLSGIVGLGRDGRVSYINQPAASLLGRRPGEAPLHARDLFGASAAAEILPVADAAPSERRLALDLARQDGGTLRAGVSVILPPPGAIEGVVLLVLFRDLDDRDGAEQELKRWEGQAALGRIVAGLSHEIRNPLAAIQGLSNVLMSECPADDPRFEPARRIGELVTRVERLIAACVEAGNPAPPRVETTTVGVLVERALAALAPRWERSGRSPRVALPGDALPVRADGAQVAQCLRALLENACEAAGDPAGVEVTAAIDGAHGAQRRVRVSVRDSGTGIPAPLLQRVFEPFYSTKPEHVGLGLAVAQALALRNGASLDARSRPGETVFTLSLPAPAAEAR